MPTPHLRAADVTFSYRLSLRRAGISAPCRLTPHLRYLVVTACLFSCAELHTDCLVWTFVRLRVPLCGLIDTADYYAVETTSSRISA